MTESFHVNEKTEKEGLIYGMFASGQGSKANITGSPAHTCSFFLREERERR